MTTQAVKAHPEMVWWPGSVWLRVALVVMIVVLVVGSLWTSGGTQTESPVESGEPTAAKIILTERMPEDAFRSGEAFWAEMDARVAWWFEDVGAKEMSHEQLAQNLVALRTELNRLGAQGRFQETWTSITEIMQRSAALCTLVPASYRTPSGRTVCDH